jgi:hypothetical protein
LTFKSAVTYLRNIRIVGPAFAVFGCLLLAADQPKQDEPKQKVQVVSKTESIDFPSTGALRLTNSVGVLTVEAWDQPDVEITTIKSTKNEIDPSDREKAMHELDKVHVAAERHGDEVVITTKYPSRHFPPPYPGDKSISFYPVARDVNFDLEYHIKVPRNARVIVNHGRGEVNIDRVVGDIQATLLQGEILLHLPEDQRYSTNAKATFGHVDSDFSGVQKRRVWMPGHRIVGEDSAATHKLNLKVKFGNIIILKILVPKPPEALTAASK